MAQLAKEAESQSNRRNRAAVGWQESNIPAEIHDIVDDGHIDPSIGAAPSNSSTNSTTSSFNSSMNRNIRQAEKWNPGDEYIMEQMDLDEITESEIDSPVRDSQEEQRKKKDVNAKEKPKTSRSTKPQKGKQKQNLTPTEEVNEAEMCPPPIFDFSSDDDTEMIQNLDMDFEGDHSDNDLFEPPIRNAKKEAFVTTRNNRTRKSSRQKTKTKDIPAPSATLRKGSRKRIPRAEQKY